MKLCKIRDIIAWCRLDVNSSTRKQFLTLNCSILCMLFVFRKGACFSLLIRCTFSNQFTAPKIRCLHMVCIFVAAVFPRKLGIVLLFSSGKQITKTLTQGERGRESRLSHGRCKSIWLAVSCEFRSECAITKALSINIHSILSQNLHLKHSEGDKTRNAVYQTQEEIYSRHVRTIVNHRFQHFTNVYNNALWQL